MENKQNDPEVKPGPIHTMVNWTMGIIFCTTLIGLAWKFIIRSLFTF